MEEEYELKKLFFIYLDKHDSISKYRCIIWMLFGWIKRLEDRGSLTSRRVKFV
jgi:hypothetical protein